jgi:hypothetical protein
MINKLNKKFITLVSLHCYTKKYGQTKVMPEHVEANND